MLHQFVGAKDGGIPMANLVFDVVGNLYGTTYAGGENTVCVWLRFKQIQHVGSAAMLLPLRLFNFAAFLNAYRVFNSASLSFKSATASLACPIFC